MSIYLYDETEVSMNRLVKCPIPVGIMECGREEILKQKKLVGSNASTECFVIHYECGVHKFHIQYPVGKWAPCDCRNTKGNNL